MNHPTISIPAAPPPPAPAAPAAEPSPAAEVASPEPGAQDGGVAQEAVPLTQQPIVEAEPEVNPLLDPENPPGFIQALDAAQEADGVKSWKGSEVDWNHVDPGIQKQVHNLRKMALNGRRETVELQRKLDERSKALDDRAAQIEAERAESLQMFKSPLLQELLKGPEGEEPNKYEDPEGFRHYHNRKDFAAMTAELVQVLGTVSDDAKTKADEALRARKRDAEVADLEAWADTIPDFDSYFDRVKGLVDDHGYDPKAAYQVLKDREELERLRSGAPPEDPLDVAERQARTRAIVPEGNRAGELLPTPTDLNGHELMAWFDAHPNEWAAHTERLRARG